MVCAPSNAAIDQIIIRIIENGLIGLKGLKQKRFESYKEEEKKGPDDDMKKVGGKKKKEEEKKTKKGPDDSESEEEYYDQPDISQSLVRITSAEYTTETAIKKFTLEQRILKKLCIEKFGDLKKCIKNLNELIS